MIPRTAATALAFLLLVSFISAAETRFVGLDRDLAPVLTAAPNVQIGIFVKDLATGETFERESRRVFPQVGAMRLHILFELFRQSRAGKLDLGKTSPVPEPLRGAAGPGILRHLPSVSMNLRDYAVVMMQLNDNVATNYLADIVGLEALAASAQALKLEQTRFEMLPARAGLDLQTQEERIRRTSSPADMAATLEYLRAGKLADRKTSDEVLKILALSKPMALRQYLPRDVSLAGLGVGGQSLRSECALITRGDASFVVCLLMERPRDSAGESDRAFTAIAAQIVARLGFGDEARR